MTQPRRALLVFLVTVQLLFVVLSVMAYRSRPQGLIASDGKAYYAWLRTLALDRDLDFENDYKLIYPPDPVPEAPLRADGRVANKTSVGVPLTEIPGFLAGHLAAAVLGQPLNGVSAPYQFAVTVWLQLLCLAALALLWAGLVRLGADPAIAAIGVASALVATNLLQYVARPAMSHAPGLSVVCIAFYLAVSAERPVSRRMVAAIGLLLGLAAIIRTSNLLVIPFFVPLLRPLLNRSALNWAALVGGAAVMFALQIGFASAQWGQLMFSSYGDEGFTAGWRGVVGTLFSSRHGLFVYHPWYLIMLALTLMAALKRETRALAIGALVSFAGFVVANGTWWSWWFGDGFGNRSFIELIPALLVPAVLWLSAAQREQARTFRIAGATAVALTFVNVVLWTGFILRRFPPNGEHTIAQAYFWWL